MSRHGIRSENQFSHLQKLDVFDEESIKQARRNIILNIVRDAVRAFASEEGRYPTSIIVGYEQSTDIQDALMSERGGGYISRESMIIDVDGYTIKVKQGCEIKDSNFSIVWWEPIDDPTDV